ncbi:MAG: hypothetical protein RR689_05135 [Mucinivorans sp.]
MTTLEALRASVNYPVPTPAFEAIAIERGLCGLDEFTQETAQSLPYQLCKADVIRYLIMTANVSEDGVSISVVDRDILLNTANAIYARYGEPLIGQKPQPTATFIG